MTRTVVVTGSASGIGAATRARLEHDGARVIGIDLRDADVIADLGTGEGRLAAVSSVEAIAPRLDAVVCCAGIDVRAPITVRVNYAASKRALCRWVRRQAPTADWAGAGIPLNAVAPGIVRTPMVEHHFDDDQKRATIERNVPMPLHGPGEPEQVAALLAWLAGPENVLVTGQIVFADRGADAVLRGDDVW